MADTYKFPIQQPDGKLATWSTGDRRFIKFDGGAIAVEVPRGLEWYTHVAEMMAVHGEDDEGVREAVRRTPDAKLLDLCVTRARLQSMMDAYERILHELCSQYTRVDAEMRVYAFDAGVSFELTVEMSPGSIKYR